MGSKQSKRSVDISGKEGEATGAGAGEVAAAGGEGRVEALADADTLKPQLNGDTPHIQPPEEISEKEKQLENGTPENEKDATTEKETVVTNGSGGEEQDKPEQDHGDAKPTPEADNNKKNKKEKVKKKWSLRSISFSRKDKPKQEKKQKDDEPKTNGETDKVPEEGIDASVVIESISSEGVKDVVVEEKKDEKTPETPVTEPITNGSSAPETPKEETPAKEDSPVSSPTIEKPVEEAKALEQHEKLPMNGLSLEDVKEEVTEVKTVEAAETKAEETSAPASEEPASTPDIPVTTEVCVGQSPLKEPTPPPLPANPPPSSVTAFAETTMAPHLVDASLISESETLPNLITVAEIASSVGDVPLSSKMDSQVSQNDIVQSNIISPPLNDIAIDTTKVESEKVIELTTSISEIIPPQIVSNSDEPNALESKELVQTPVQAPVSDIVVQEEQLMAETVELAAQKSVPATSNLENLVHAADSSEPEVAKTVLDNNVEPIAQTDNLKDVIEEKLDTQKIQIDDYKENVLSNGSLKTDLIQEPETLGASSTEITKAAIQAESINSSLQKNASLVNNISETNSKDEEKINGSIDQNSDIVLEPISEKTIISPSKPEMLPIALSNNAEETSMSKGDEAQSASPVESVAASLSEALPPPVPLQEDACESEREDNRGSNEEISESFPLPPSELCPSESEVSGAATPELPQELAPVTENTAEISVPEILADKALVADITEVTSPAAAAPEAVATAGAGDGAPSN